jgi:transcription initiation factor IIE alpha subunit
MKYDFSKAMDVSFMCEVCSQPLKRLDNSKLKTALELKINEIQNEETE